MRDPDYLITVGLYFRGDKLDPAVVSTTLGISPTESHWKGEQRVTSAGSKFVTKTGLWKLISGSASKVLSDHLDDLSSKIRPDVDLGNISGVEDAFVDVFFCASANDDGGGDCDFQLRKENLNALQRLGLPVRFVLSVVKEEKPPKG